MIEPTPFGIYTADVTPIVKDWVNGNFDNNGFVLFGTGDVFQGAGLVDAQLVVPEPSGLTLVPLGFLGLLVCRRPCRR